jgi:hypothetical protein
MTETLPSPLEYFSDEEVPFGDSPNTFVYIKFNFKTMEFALNVKENGDDEFLGGDAATEYGASEDSINEFVVEVCNEYGVKSFPASLWKKATTFVEHRQYTESFNTLVTKPSVFKTKAAPDTIKALYFKPLPGAFSGYLSVERNGESFAGILEDREQLTGSVRILNEALQEATEMDAVAKTFCLLTEVARQLPGHEVSYSNWVNMLIPYAHPRPRLAEELLNPGDGEIPYIDIARVPDRRLNPLT